VRRFALGARNQDLEFSAKSATRVIGYGHNMLVEGDHAAWLVVTAWQPLGLGVNSSRPGTPVVFGMVLAGTCLFVGGDFERAGNTTSSRAAIWSLTANVRLTGRAHSESELRQFD
jgi:hypothetical protein